MPAPTPSQSYLAACDRPLARARAQEPAIHQAADWFADTILRGQMAARHTCALRDAHQKHSMESAMSKVFAAETAMWVTTKAVQIHGGLGYTKSYPVERYMRDAKITEIYEGTSEVQRIVISAGLLK